MVKLTFHMFCLSMKMMCTVFHFYELSIVLKGLWMTCDIAEFAFSAGQAVKAANWQALPYSFACALGAFSSAHRDRHLIDQRKKAFRNQVKVVRTLDFYDAFYPLPIFSLLNCQ